MYIISIIMVLLLVAIFLRQLRWSSREDSSETSKTEVTVIDQSQLSVAIEEHAGDKSWREYLDRWNADTASVEIEYKKAVAVYEAQLSAEIAQQYTFKPVIKLIEYPVGTFLSYESFEIPARWIASISVNGITQDTKGYFRSSAPTRSFGEGLVLREMPKVGQAFVEVTMNSGQIHYIACTRYQAPALLDALLVAWKNTRV